MRIVKTTLARGHMLFALADGRYMYVQGEMTLGMKFYADKGFAWYWIEEPKRTIYLLTDANIIRQVTDGEKDELAVAITEYYRDKEFQVIVE